MRSFLRPWFPVLVYAILIFWLSSLERPFGVEFKTGYVDKLAHLLEYTIFGFLLIRAIYGSNVNISRRTAIIIAFIIGACYGFTDELHQSVVPGRSASVFDFIFDCMGTFVGSVVFTKLHRELRPNR
jgi:VanZ family protein